MRVDCLCYHSEEGVTKDCRVIGIPEKGVIWIWANGEGGVETRGSNVGKAKVSGAVGHRIHEVEHFEATV